MNEQNWTIVKIIDWTTKFFIKHNIKEARYKTELLISEILNMKRYELYVNFEYELLESESTLLKTYIKRVLDREPIQYILGNWEFYGYTLDVNKNVLIPRSETEELVERVINYIKSISDKLESFTILDLGTGSGAIIIALYKELEKKLDGDSFRKINFIASDYSLDALEVAKSNSEKNSCEIEFIHSDLFENLQNKKINLLISNPPYISIDDYNNLEKELSFEPQMALTDNNNGLYFYQEIIKFISKRNISSAFLEIGYDQKDTISEICKKNNIKNFDIYKDLSNNDRILEIKQ